MLTVFRNGVYVLVASGVVLVLLSIGFTMGYALSRLSSFCARRYRSWRYERSVAALRKRYGQLRLMQSNDYRNN